MVVKDNRSYRLGALIILLMVSLGCNGFVPRLSNTESVVATELIGFDFTQGPLQCPEGDTGAPNHVFIHKYPMPGKGEIVGVLYLNDSESPRDSNAAHTAPSPVQARRW